MYTLDTNAIIYYSRGDPHAVKILDEIFLAYTPLYLSTVSEIELFGFPFLADEEEDRIEQFLRAVTVIPLDSHIARLAASLRRRHQIKTIDSAIAATALATRSSLITRNTKDFTRVPTLQIVPL